MKFLLASTFQDSLNKLNKEEQTRVKNSAFDLQLNPKNPGLNSAPPSISPHKSCIHLHQDFRHNTFQVG